MNLTEEETNELLTQLHELNFKMLCAFDDICKQHHITYYIAYGTLLGAVRHQDFVPWDDDVDVIMTRPEFEKLCAVSDQFGDRYILQNPETEHCAFHDNIPKFADTQTIMKNDLELCARYNNINNLFLCIDIFLLEGCSDDQKVCQSLYQRILWGLAMGHRHAIDYSAYQSFISKAQAFTLATAGRLIPLKTIEKWRKNYILKYKDVDTTYMTITNQSPFDWDEPPHRREWFDLENGGAPVQVTLKGRQFPAPRDWDAVLTHYYGDYMELPPVEQQKPDHAFRTWECFKVLDAPYRPQ